MLNENIENEDYYNKYNEYKWANLMKTIFSMLALFLTICNYQYDLTVNHADYLYKEIFPGDSSRFEWLKLYANYNNTVRWIVLILTYSALYFLIRKNLVKRDWTNKYFNKILMKEKISDKSTYYHFSIEIVGNDDKSWDQDLMEIKDAVFFNYYFLREAFILIIIPYPGFERVFFVG